MGFRDSENGDVNRDNGRIKRFWDTLFSDKPMLLIVERVLKGVGGWGDQKTRHASKNWRTALTLIHHQVHWGLPAGTASAFSSRRHDRGLCIP